MNMWTNKKIPFFGATRTSRNKNNSRSKRNLPVPTSRSDLNHHGTPRQDAQDAYEGFLGKEFSLLQRSLTPESLMTTSTRRRPSLSLPSPRRQRQSRDRKKAKLSVKRPMRAKSFDESVLSPRIRGRRDSESADLPFDNWGKSKTTEVEKIRTTPLVSALKKWRQADESIVAPRVPSTTAAATTTTSTADRPRRSRLRLLDLDASLCSHWRLQSSEEQTKFTRSRVSVVDEHFGHLCRCLGTQARRQAKLRDSGDALASALVAFSRAEHVNASASEALRRLAEGIAAVEDFREARLQRMETLVVSRLRGYETVCRNAKDDLRDHVAILNREKSKYQHLQRVRDKNPTNKNLIVQACEELRQATSNTKEVELIMAESLVDFERRKLEDLQATLKDVVGISLAFHAKAIEIFTKAHNDLKEMNIDHDVAEVEKVIYIPSTSSSTSPVQRRRDGDDAGWTLDRIGRLTRSAPALPQLQTKTFVIQKSNEELEQRGTGDNANTKGVSWEKLKSTVASSLSSSTSSDNGDEVTERQS